MKVIIYKIWSFAIFFLNFVANISMSFFEKNFANLEKKKSKNRFFEIVFLFFELFWKIIKLTFAPAFWVYGQNVRLYQFAFGKTENRKLNQEEIELVHSLPTVYILTGLVAGVFVSLFAVLDFKDIIDTFITALSSNIVEATLGLLGSFILFIYELVLLFINFIASIFVWIFETFIEAYAINPFLGLVGLLMFGFLGVGLYLVINERLAKEFQKVVFYFVGSPDRTRTRMENFYRKVNEKQFRALMGYRDQSNKKIYFKQLVFYSLLLLVYSIVSSISISLNPDYLELIDSVWVQVSYIISIHFVAGFLSGTLFLKLVSVLLDVFSGLKSEKKVTAKKSVQSPAKTKAVPKPTPPPAPVPQITED
jgi:hypothetical protein